MLRFIFEDAECIWMKLKTWDQHWDNPQIWKIWNNKDKYNLTIASCFLFIEAGSVNVWFVIFKFLPFRILKNDIKTAMFKSISDFSFLI
jgi:hypothetical protein